MELRISEMIVNVTVDGCPIADNIPRDLPGDVIFVELKDEDDDDDLVKFDLLNIDACSSWYGEK